MACRWNQSRSIFLELGLVLEPIFKGFFFLSQCPLAIFTNGGLKFKGKGSIKSLGSLNGHKPLGNLEKYI